MVNGKWSICWQERDKLRNLSIRNRILSSSPLASQNSSSHLESPATTNPDLRQNTGQNLTPRGKVTAWQHSSSWSTNKQVNNLPVVKCPTLLTGPGLPVCDNISCSDLTGISFKFYFWWFPKLLKILLVLDQTTSHQKGSLSFKQCSDPKTFPHDACWFVPFLKLVELWAACWYSFNRLCKSAIC